MVRKSPSTAKVAAEPTPSFSFDSAVQAVDTKAKGKAPSYPSIPVPPAHAQGLKDYLAAKKLESEAEALIKGASVVALKEFAYDTWLAKGCDGTFSSSLKFTSTFGDVLYISARAWKKINNEEDANFLRGKLGVDNFNQMVNKTTTLVGELSEVETKFNELVKEGKIDAKTAKTVFEFLITTFKRDTAYEFKKDVLDWQDVFALAGGDKDLADKVINTTLSKKPYLREA